jgi:hypothetical protein
MSTNLYKQCPNCNRWFTKQQTFRHHIRACRRAMRTFSKERDMIDATVAAISIKMMVIVNTLVRIVISPSWIVVIFIQNQASRPVGGENVGHNLCCHHRHSHEGTLVQLLYTSHLPHGMTNNCRRLDCCSHDGTAGQSLSTSHLPTVMMLPSERYEALARII